MINRNDLTIFANDPAEILAGVYADYRTITGRRLQPGQTETLLLNVFAYREYVLREQANEALRNSLVPFAVAPMLDYLGAFVGVERLAPSGAITTLSFTTGGNNPAPVVVPSGTRVATRDAQYTFETTADLTIPTRFNGPVALSVEGVCTKAGKEGNGQTPSEILDPVSYVTGVSATTPTGGTSGENDEQLRERIQLAPNSFSVAGPINAYKFFAKEAHPAVIDVAVVTTFPGEVTLYPLVSGGVPAPEIIAAVETACNAEDVRPLCDSVKVLAPTVRSYTISVELELLTGTAVNPAKAAALAAVTDYANNRASGLGRDAVREQISARSMGAGVYRANVLTPAATLVIAENEVAICTGISVNVIGFNNG